MGLLIVFLFAGAIFTGINIFWRGRRHKKLLLTITRDMPREDREMIYYAANGIQRAICIDRLTTTIWFMMAIFMAVANSFWGQAGMNG